MKTRVFANGNSQAVRIPREFRLDVSTVRISRRENGDIVLHPVPDEPQDRAQALLALLAKLDDDAIASIEAAHDDQGQLEDREPL